MLVLVTKPYHSDSDFVQKMRTWARQSLRKDRVGLGPVG